MQPELGEFLRAQRAALTPEQTGLPSHGLRRVHGLRREEVAVLTGVSVDYYTRLEQGREKNPSIQIIEALATGLGLDPDARAHAFRLAGLLPPATGSAPRPRADPELARLLTAWPTTPAFVLSDALDVLARNPLAAALYRGFEKHDNLLRMTFLDPEGRRFYTDWQRAAEAAVGNLREASGRNPGDRRIAELVTELSEQSEDFREIWGRQRVRSKRHEPKVFSHPDVGELALTYFAFDVRGARAQQLIVYAAEPGTPSADNLALLSTLVDRPRIQT
ncbi:MULTISPECIES: helix-turn-helix transcriptional regulator [Catenuloplanes]|uniref:Transcriptional regulator with XRE-family HTH domain n=1 Tax=Catenuloplanes niger TaxID=587534 RepID=A0AAE4CX32_9ACTN|nr:helix-turn-helix transcriptional regulator [Catenuloplanes niger]MDR7327057.1 transcriptional regulator with XRE-family HTH domain [Catenuloplanes niger]